MNLVYARVPLLLVSDPLRCASSAADICSDYGFTLIFAQLVRYHRNPRASLRSIS